MTVPAVRPRSTRSAFAIGWISRLVQIGLTLAESAALRYKPRCPSSWCSGTSALVNVAITLYLTSDFAVLAGPRDPNYNGWLSYITFRDGIQQIVMKGEPCQDSSCNAI